MFWLSLFFEILSISARAFLFFSGYIYMIVVPGIPVLIGPGFGSNDTVDLRELLWY